ncbi:MAG TPA: TetR/AcrR family transcriptional regulator [Marmoricola sp.]|nr:TetR/AcrR family transcriptional regulator [Marmoricola sp.]
MSGRSSGDGRKARWEEHNTARRRQIIEAAVALVEEQPPGTEVHVRQIAERAGVGRPVVYRYFADRADLDRAVQDHVLELLRDAVAAEVGLTGTIEQIILRIVSGYVRWAASHPALHRLAEQDRSGPGEVGALELVIKQIVDLVAELFTSAIELLHVELDEDDLATLDPLIFGLVGQVFGAVRRWLWRAERAPSADVLAGALARAIWHEVSGLAADRGVRLDPQMPLDELLLGALAEPS